MIENDDEIRDLIDRADSKHLYAYMNEQRQQLNRQEMELDRLKNIIIQYVVSDYYAKERED